MRKFFIILSLVITPLFSYGQKLSVRFEGVITNQDLSKKEAGVSVQIIQNGSAVASGTTASNGKYTLKGEVDHTKPFDVVYSKNGMVSKKVAFDLKNLNQEDTPPGDFAPLQSLDLDLFNERPGVDFGFLQKDPVAKFDMRPGDMQLKLDQGASAAVKKKVDDLLKSAAEKDKANAANFSKLVAEANKLYDAKNFDGALAKYEEAAKIEPKDKHVNTRINEIYDLQHAKKEAALADKQKNQEYYNLIQAGDNLYKQGDLEKAKARYKEASMVNEEEDYPLDQIKKINKEIKQKEDDAKYKQLVDAADIMMKQKSYKSARDNYENASKLRPTEAYPKEQMTKIDGILKGEEEVAEKKKKYEDAIAAADNAYNAENWAVAKEKYTDALTFESASTYAKGRKADVEAKMEAAEAEKKKQEQIGKLLKEGDDFVNKTSYQEALGKYNEALKLDDKNQTVKDKIANANQLMADAQKAKDLQAKYDATIKDADLLRDGKKYDEAIAKYTVAQGLMDKPYPTEQIEKINKIKADEKAAADKAAAEKAEAERLAKEAADKAAAEKAEQERLAKEAAEKAAAERAEAERLAKEAEAKAAAEKAEKERLAKEEAERLAKEAADKAAAEKAEAERLAKEAAEKAAAERAEAERLAKEAEAKAAAEKAEKERLAKEEAERLAKEAADKAAAEKAEQERLAKEAADKAAAEKAEAERLAKEEAERLAREAADKAALERSEAERLAKEASEKAAAERAEAERLAKEADAKSSAEKAEKERLAKEEAERLAREATEKAALERSEAERLAKEASEKAAAERAEAERLAKEADAKSSAEKAEKERLAKEEAERLAREAIEKAALERSEAERLAKEASEKAAAERAEAERLAKEADAKSSAEKAEKERLAKEEAERLAREATEKAALERSEAERLAKEASEKAAAERAEAERLAKEAEAKSSAEKAEKERLAKEEAERLAREATEKAALERSEAERLAKEASEKAAAERAEAERLAKEADAKSSAEKAAAERAEADRLASEAASESQRKKNEAQQELIEKEYQSLLAKGDALVEQKKYAEAIESYNKALNVKPDESLPVQKARAAQDLSVRDQNEANQAFEKLITAIENKMNEEDFAKARDYITRANSIRSNDPRPSSLLKQVERLEKEHQLYVKNMQDAETKVKAEQYTEAIVLLTQAKDLKPKKTEPQKRIDEINELILQQANAKSGEAQFNQMMALGKAAEDKKVYTEALKYYKRAKELRSDDGKVTAKIAEVEAKMAQAQQEFKLKKAKDDHFNGVVKTADDAFNSGDYQKAVAYYGEAKTLRPDNTYVKGKYDEAVRMNKLDANKEMAEQYSKIIALADENFNTQNWSKAQEYYQRAVDLKKSDEYPRKQLEIINNIVNPPTMASAELSALGEEFDPSMNPELALLQADAKRKDIKIQKARKVKETAEDKNSAETLQKRQEQQNTLDMVYQFYKDAMNGDISAADKKLIEMEMIKQKEQKIAELGKQNELYKANENIRNQDLITQEQQRYSYAVEAMAEGKSVDLEEIERIRLAAENERTQSEFRLHQSNLDNKQKHEQLATKVATESEQSRAVIEDTRNLVLGKDTESSEMVRRGADANYQKAIEGKIQVEQLYSKNEAYTNDVNEEKVLTHNQIALTESNATQTAAQKEYDKMLANRTSKEKLEELEKKKSTIHSEAEEEIREKDRQVKILSRNQQADETIKLDNRKQEIYQTQQDLEVKREQSSQSQEQAVDAQRANQQKVADINKTATMTQNSSEKEKMQSSLAIKNQIDRVEPTTTQTAHVKNTLGEKYPEGVSQEMFQRKDENGLPVAIITRRVVVIDGKGIEYIKTQTVDAITYTKSGTAITEYVWQKETNNAALKRHF